jgi:hypothetical protein
MVTLWCVLCGEAYRSSGTIPPSCPRCLQTTRWTTRASVDIPKVRYALSWMDVRFLHSLRIDPEERPFIDSVAS